MELTFGISAQEMSLQVPSLTSQKVSIKFLIIIKNLTMTSALFELCVKAGILHADISLTNLMLMKGNVQHPELVIDFNYSSDLKSER